MASADGSGKDRRVYALSQRLVDRFRQAENRSGKTVGAGGEKEILLIMP